MILLLEEARPQATFLGQVYIHTHTPSHRHTCRHAHTHLYVHADRNGTVHGVCTHTHTSSQDRLVSS